MSREYKKWPDLTPEQQSEAQKIAQFVGYKPEDLSNLLYGIDGDIVISLRDNFLLGNIFPAEPASFIGKGR